MEISILSSSPSCMKPCLQQSDLRTQRQSRFPQPPDGYISFVSIIPFVLFYDKIVINLFVPHRSPSAWEWIACKEDTSGRRSSRGPGPGTVHSITSLWTNQSFLEMWIQSLLSSVLSGTVTITTSASSSSSNLAIKGSLCRLAAAIGLHQLHTAQWVHL